jgi:hypothetical protein
MARYPRSPVLGATQSHVGVMPHMDMSASNWDTSGGRHLVVPRARKRIRHRVQPLIGDAVEIVLRLPQRGALSGAPSGDPPSLDNDGLESRGFNVTKYPVLVEWVHGETDRRQSWRSTRAARPAYNCARTTAGAPRRPSRAIARN